MGHALDESANTVFTGTPPCFRGVLSNKKQGLKLINFNYAAAFLYMLFEKRLFYKCLRLNSC